MAKMIQVGSGYSKTNASKAGIKKKNARIQLPHIEGIAPESSLRRFLFRLDQRFFRCSRPKNQTCLFSQFAKLDLQLILRVLGWRRPRLFRPQPPRDTFRISIAKGRRHRISFDPYRVQIFVGMPTRKQHHCQL